MTVEQDDLAKNLLRAMKLAKETKREE